MITCDSQRLFTLLATLICLFPTDSVWAETYYVDNRIGDDVFNGRSGDPLDSTVGPFRTISRAMRIAKEGDTIKIANRGVPYREALTLQGTRTQAPGDLLILIEGNGAVISGDEPVPEDAWELVRGDIWRFEPRRKGHYLLLQHGKPFTEFPCPRTALSLPEFPRGQWCVWQGAIYFHGPKFRHPRDLEMSFGAREVGLTLYEVRHVEIRNLTFQHFRLDGVNAHDRCRDVILDGVRCVENGRAGLTVAGSSQVEVYGGELNRNRRDNLLVTERGEVGLHETWLNESPPAADAPPEPAAESP